MKKVVIWCSFIASMVVVALPMVDADHVTSATSPIAASWNAHRRAAACKSQSGRHDVCDIQVGGAHFQDRPPLIPPGWRTVFYTTGCAHCAVGWVLVPGERCGPKDLNCMD